MFLYTHVHCPAGGQPRLDEDAVLSVMTGRLDGAMFFYRAEVDEDRLGSEGYTRARSRHSYYFLVHYLDERTEQEKPYIGVVRAFVKLPGLIKPDGDEKLMLRFLLVRLLNVAKQGRKYVANGGLSGPGWPLYAMPFTVLQGRAWRRCIVALPKSGVNNGRAYFMPYNNISEH